MRLGFHEQFEIVINFFEWMLKSKSLVFKYILVSRIRVIQVII